jgi:nitrite reductase/ring-hydroxylating ferredoxin subunit
VIAGQGNLLGGTPPRRLCAMAEIPDGGSKGFASAGAEPGLFAVRRGGEVRVYVNACPHLGLGLEWLPDRFLSADGDAIVCATHGALFRIEDGLCHFGPCYGERLEAVDIVISDGIVFTLAGAGP